MQWRGQLEYVLSARRRSVISRTDRRLRSSCSAMGADLRKNDSLRRSAHAKTLILSASLLRYFQPTRTRLQD